MVSACRKEGVTSFVGIKSLAGEPCIIQPSIIGKPEIWNPDGRELEEVGEGCYQISLKKGEEIILYPGDLKPDLSITPVPMEKNQLNYFGSP